MPDTLFLLRLEHGNLSKLLGLIEHQVAAADAGRPMDAELLSLACEYLCDYPDRCHHPKEDLVYRRLSERAPDSRAGLHDLVAQHRRLHELTEAFAEAVRRVREEPQAAEPGPREAMREFTQRYRQHMQEEDERFFPLAEQRLSKDDWDALDFAMFDRDDPLFDHAAEERFWALRERIDTLAEQGGARASVLDAANGLRGLSGIESFNESMKSADTDLSVTASYCFMSLNAHQSEPPGVHTAICAVSVGHRSGSILRLIPKRTTPGAADPNWKSRLAQSGRFNLPRAD
jgi:hemerythrin-like domain-containing protein